MPRVRGGSEMAPRVSTRGPTSLRSSESDPSHHRPITDRSPKFGDRRSPRSVNSDPLSQKKLGTRIAGLETQLGQAQDELKILKYQLASAEAAKKEAQKELEKKTVKPVISVPGKGPDPGQDTRCSPSENPDENQKETDVFEVPVDMLRSLEISQSCDQDEVKVKVNDSVKVPEKDDVEVIAVKNEEISLLKMTIEEKEKKLETLGEENEVLKCKLTDAKVKQEKLNVKLTQIDQELKKSTTEGVELNEKLKEVERVKEAMEVEMRRLRVQTEQWRKAADAAAAILAGGEEGRRVSERCGSMDKNYGGVFEGFDDDSDDGFGSGKRKGSGIRMFGDLWKKKGHK